MRSGEAISRGDVDSQQTLRLALGLRTPDPAGEQRFIDALEDRSSPSFHHFLTPAQWNARFSPSVASERAVVEWARSMGLTITDRYPNRLIVDVSGTVATIDRAFSVHLRNYTDRGESYFANDSEPVMPADVGAIVRSVDGLNDIQQMHPAGGDAPTANPTYVAGPAEAAGPTVYKDGDPAKLPRSLQPGAAPSGTSRTSPASTASAGAERRIDNGVYTPPDFYTSQAYDYAALRNQGHCCNPFHTGSASPREATIAIASYGSQSGADFSGFLGLFPFLASNIAEYWIDGTPAAGDIEGTADGEWALATSNSFGCGCDTAKVIMYDGVNRNDATVADLYNHILNDNFARVFETSWSCTEVYGCSDAAMDTRHSIFNSMLGQGWTLMAASGDRGAYDDCSHASVGYPQSDPDVLAVGGTQLTLTANDTFVSEVAWGANSQGCANNGGGSGGGCSSHFSAGSYDTLHQCGTARSIPDLALNADWLNTPQRIYVNGGAGTWGGTSIAAPEMAGFFAQENAYQLSYGKGPVGDANFPVWAAGKLTGTHSPFYDITSGCNSNNVGTGYCATPGYDLVTGWGSVNMLQLAWDLNWFTGYDNGRPTVSLTNTPEKNVWWRTNPAITWTVADTGGSGPPTGVAGFSSAWDQAVADPVSEPHPGSGGVFYDGPQVPNGTTGTVHMSDVGQGCHTIHILAWDNEGLSSGDQYYGPMCYDPYPPVVDAAPKATLAIGSRLITAGVPVTITWHAVDGASGVNSYVVERKVDKGSYAIVSQGSSATSITQTLAAGHMYQYQVLATDVAGNASAFVSGSAFKVNLVQENGAGVIYSAGWTHQALAGSSGGSVDFSTTKGRTATFTFTGKELAWVTTRAPNRGVASIKLDAAAPVSVDTKSSSTSTEAIMFVRAFGVGKHTIVITNPATAGRARIDVDAFVFLS
ncbi:MAG TPA: protease pro-enzyme activation domain-containing protein [Acidimicrobiia bacterium]